MLTLNQRAVGSTPTRPTKINHVQAAVLLQVAGVDGEQEKIFPAVVTRPLLSYLEIPQSVSVLAKLFSL